MFGPVGFYHVPSSAECFSDSSFCLIYCCLGSPFCSLQGHGSSYFGILSPEGVVGPVPCEGFSVRVTGASVLLVGTGSYFSDDQCHVQWGVRGVCELGMALGSLSVR